MRLLRACLLDLPGDPVMIAGVPGLRGHLADRLLERTHRDRRKRHELLSRYEGLSAEEARAVARTRAVLPHAEITVKRYPLPPEEIAALLKSAGA